MRFLTFVLCAVAASAEHPLTENDVKSLALFRDTVLTVVYNGHFRRSRDGSEWPSGPAAHALSMAGQRRIDNAVELLAQAMADEIRGDFIETGVWRGGLSFVAAKTLELAGSLRKAWLCDSFQGIPKATNVAGRKTNRQDASAHTLSILNNNSLQGVRHSAKLMHVDPERTEYVKGYFDKTLPALVAARPELRFAVIRLDGDTFDSTWAAIGALYPRLEPGGFIIVDDYMDWVGCRDAITKYRADHAIVDPIFFVAHAQDELTRGIYWRKSGNGPTSGDRMCPAAWKISLGGPGARAHRARAETLAMKGQRVPERYGVTMGKRPILVPAGLRGTAAASDLFYCEAAKNKGADAAGAKKIKKLAELPR